MTWDSFQVDILAELARSARSYLEIGVADGRTALAVARAQSALGRFVLVDTWGRRSGGAGRGSHAHVALLLAEVGYDAGRVEFLDGESQRLVPERLGREPIFDLVHVDGDHSRDAALADFENCWRVCRRKMVVHDAMMTGVWEAVALFVAANRESIADARVFFGGHGTVIFERSAIA